MKTLSKKDLKGGITLLILATALVLIAGYFGADLS